MGGPGEHTGMSGHFPIVIQNPTNIFNQETKMIRDRFYDHSSMETGIITLFHLHELPPKQPKDDFILATSTFLLKFSKRKHSVQMNTFF